MTGSVGQASAMKIVFLDRDTLSPQTHLRAPAFAHALVCLGRTTAAEVAARIADADIVLVNKVRLDAAALAAAPRLKFIGVAATGTDHIDLDACRARGIVVSNIRHYAVHTVPEHTFALIS
jgi:glycerate dehydrogenase